MTFFKSLLKLLKEGEKIRVFKTIYYNFKLFPFSKAKYLPLFIYGKAELNIARGAIELCPSFLSPGLIKVGCHKSPTLWGYIPTGYTVLNILGRWVCKGAIQIANGALVKVGSAARFVSGHDVNIGPNSKLVCEREIILGKRVRASWECQVFDTDFHFCIKGDAVRDNKAPIVIGDYCWIGSRVSILKGAVVPAKAVIASNSMVNKNFGAQPECCLLCGTPAACKPIGIRRFYAAANVEAELARYFDSSGKDSLSTQDPFFVELFKRSLEYKDSAR